VRCFRIWEGTEAACAAVSSPPGQLTDQSNHSLSVGKPSGTRHTGQDFSDRNRTSGPDSVGASPAGASGPPPPAIRTVVSRQNRPHRRDLPFVDSA
jgi:hypothetical protein